jgi:hypothetical protein
LSSSQQQQRSKPQIYVHRYLQLKLFGKQQTVDLLLVFEIRKDVSRHKEQVKKNTRILCRFIDVCSLANQEFLFRRHDESFKSLNKINFVEFLNALKKS